MELAPQQPAMNHPMILSFKPGFRINTIDCIFIIIGIMLAWVASEIALELSIISILPFTAFFMFCNVFRIRRIPELVWALLFILNTFMWHLLQMNIGYYVLINLLTFVVTIAIEMRHPSYHGVLWKIINPNLMVWFSKNMKSTQQGDAPEPLTRPDDL